MRFLHLSDIHFDYKIKNADSQTLRTLLLEKLADIKSKGIDFIVITGDIFFKNRHNLKPQDIINSNEKLIQFIDDLCKVTNCSKENVFLCPGNHDPDRQNEERNKIIKKSREENNFEIDTKKQNDLHAAFSLFEQTYKSIKGKEYHDYEVFEVTIENKKNKNHKKTRIFSVNSALFSCEDDERGGLSVYNKIFLESEKKLSGKLDKSVLNILIMHHSVTCLTHRDFMKLQHWCEDKGIDIVLCGHSHLMGIFTYNQTAREIPEFTCGSLIDDQETTPTFLIYDFNPNKTDNLIVQLYAYFTAVNAWRDATALNRKFVDGKYHCVLPRFSQQEITKIQVPDSKGVQKQLENLFDYYDKQIVENFGAKAVKSSAKDKPSFEFKTNKIFTSLLNVDIPFRSALDVIKNSVDEIIKNKDRLLKDRFDTKYIFKYVYNSIAGLKGENLKEVEWAGKYARRNLVISEIQIDNEKFDIDYIRTVFKEIIETTGIDYSAYRKAFEKDTEVMINNIYNFVKTFETIQLDKNVFTSLIIQIYSSEPHPWFNYKFKEGNQYDRLNIADYNYGKYRKHLNSNIVNLSDQQEIIQGVALYELLYHSVCMILPFYYPIFGANEKQPMRILHKAVFDNASEFETQIKENLRIDFKKYCSSDDSEYGNFRELLDDMHKHIGDIHTETEKKRIKIGA
jgi:predicted phosphodiesterase